MAAKTWSNEVREICWQIGVFYLKKFGGCYEEAEKRIVGIGFEDVVLMKDGSVEIYVRRPGLFIGKRGEDVGKLSEHLGRKIKIFEENCIEDFIIPIDYAEIENTEDLSQSCYMDDWDESPYPYHHNEDN